MNSGGQASCQESLGAGDIILLSQRIVGDRNFRAGLVAILVLRSWNASWPACMNPLTGGQTLAYVETGSKLRSAAH